MPRKSVARIARLLVEIAETLADLDEPAETATMIRRTKPAETFSVGDIISEMVSEFEDHPGYESISFDPRNPKQITVSSSDDSWYAEVTQWARTHAPNAFISFVLTQPKQSVVQPIRHVPRRCPKCNSLRCIPVSDGQWKCERCQLIFDLAAIPSNRPKTAVDALSAMIKSDDASDNVSIYSGPARNP